MNKSKILEENADVLSFLIKNKEYAYQLEEIKESTGIDSLSHKQIGIEKDIECRILPDGIYYIYKPYKQQFHEALDYLVSCGKIRKTVENGVEKYMANDDKENN